MIEVEGLVKAYESVTAVDGLSFRVAKGEVLGLVGPNGAGKTTTLRCLAGILAPNAGTIRLGGFDLLKQPVEARRRLAFMPDEPRLFEYLTVE
ncbi:MAG: ATP-binding cassette domain-containing protein, partial [Acidobacteriota bacterium]